MQGQPPGPGALASHWPEVRQWSAGCRAVSAFVSLSVSGEHSSFLPLGLLSGDPRV